MDVSCASATGIFDPFTMKWANWMLDILKLPRNILPEVVDTVGNFGTIPESVFGAEIPIYCSVSDGVTKYFDINKLTFNLTINYTTIIITHATYIVLYTRLYKN